MGWFCLVVELPQGHGDTPSSFDRKPVLTNLRNMTHVDFKFIIWLFVWFEVYRILLKQLFYCKVWTTSGCVEEILWQGAGAGDWAEFGAGEGDGGGVRPGDGSLAMSRILWQEKKQAGIPPSSSLTPFLLSHSCPSYTWNNLNLSLSPSTSPHFSLNPPLGRFSLSVAMSVHLSGCWSPYSAIPHTGDY